MGRKLILRNHSCELPNSGERFEHSSSGSPKGLKKLQPKRSSPRNIMIKLSKIKDNKINLKELREKNC